MSAEGRINHIMPAVEWLFRQPVWLHFTSVEGPLKTRRSYGIDLSPRIGITLCLPCKMGFAKCGVVRIDFCDWLKG